MPMYFVTYAANDKDDANVVRLFAKSKYLAEKEVSSWVDCVEVLEVQED